MTFNRSFLGLFLLIPLHAGAEISFNRDIRPILSDKCFKCHGPDADNQKSDFRIDSFANATQDLGGYAGIVPGNLKKSEVDYVIHSDDEDDMMPPPKSKLALTQKEKDLLSQWIKEGARYEKHWAFTELPAQITPPASKHPTPHNPIDHFIAQRLEKEKLAPAPATTREQWLRRVTFDLTGLPPTLAELDTFLADQAPDAFVKQIDRLLATPASAERLTNEWLDVARYSDSYGYQVDRARSVWPWRDWVIRSFQKNLPYDQFITQQLAGDLLPETTQETRLATTFNRLHGQKCEGGSDPEEFRLEYVSDRVHTAGTAFLGLTMECTKCHDHKYDPLTQVDYFSFAAFFANIDEHGLYAHSHGDSVPSPSLALSSPPQEKQLAERQKRIADLENSPPADLQAKDPALQEPEVKKVFGTSKEEAHLFNGDHPQTLKRDPALAKRHHPFTLHFEIFLPQHYEDAILYTHSRASLDAAYRGHTLKIKEGKLQSIFAHFYPGNAIEVFTKDSLPLNQWLKLTVTYDGSSRAKGFTFYLDGKSLPAEITYDTLTNRISPGDKYQDIRLGAQSRDRGLTNGKIHQFQLFANKSLDPAQVKKLCNNQPLQKSTEPIRAWQQRLLEARQAYNTLLDRIPRIMTMAETKGTPRKTHLLNRGLFSDKGPELQANTPAILPPLKTREDGQAATRLDLAQWLTQPNHPLTARVAVNRYWQMLFGTGLVRTSEDFGNQGSAPTHPELLDWLARDFIDSGWDVRHLLKQIVLSHSYRQSSITKPSLLEKDPGNELLARYPTVPLTAEMLRDNALALSGLLSRKVGGAAVKPYDLAFAFKPTPASTGENLYRRSLYTHWQVNGPSPLMLTLDAAKRHVCTVKREKTATPLQSLVLLNSPQFVEAARVTAEQLLGKSADPADFLPQAFRLATARQPNEQEMKILHQLYNEQFKHFQQHPAETTEFLKVGQRPANEKLPPASLAALTNTVLALLNYDATLMKR